MNKIRLRFRHEILFLVAGLMLGLLVFPLLYYISTDVMGLLLNLVPEALGIIFTVILIDRLYRNHEERQLKKRLLEQLGSRVNAVAIAAAEELWANDWWSDGSLRGANLYRADLRGVDFGKADLTNVKFEHPRYGKAMFDETSILPDETTWSKDSDLEIFTNPTHTRYWRGYGLSNKDYRGMNFAGANLRGADLRGSDLRGANLAKADLRGSRMEGAKLNGADFTQIQYDNRTLLPDGSVLDLEHLKQFDVVIKADQKNE